MEEGDPIQPVSVMIVPRTGLVRPGLVDKQKTKIIENCGAIISWPVRRPSKSWTNRSDLSDLTCDVDTETMSTSQIIATPSSQIQTLLY